MKQSLSNRIVSVLLSLCIVLGLVATGAPLGVMPTLHAATNHNMGEGDLFIDTPGDYVITGSSSGSVILIQTDGTYNITLQNVSIAQGGSSFNPFIIDANATVNLTLLGNNTITGDPAYAGVYVSQHTTLNITSQSTGTLTVIGGSGAPAIGDDLGGPFGTVSINGGYINATGGGGGAPDIGSSGGGSGVTITGGSVKADSIIPAPTNGTNAVYKTTVTISGVSSVTAVTYTVDGGSAINAVTDANGQLYLWLPVGARSLAVTAGSKTYTASVTVTTGTNTATATAGPSVTPANISLSGGTGMGGAFKIGDTVTATWNNTALGDNNSNLTAVTMDFTAFGGGNSVPASNNSGIWTATYTITAGTINNVANRNVSVTVTDSTSRSTTATGTTNARVDNVSPTVTDGAISISGATGAGGAYKVGDTVTATWNNTAGGDNNSDINAVYVNFSAFGGGSAVTATNTGDSWTATYTIASGSINNEANRNISVTAVDECGNATATADTTNATVDNKPPIVTAPNVTVSGASGADGLFLTGDTVTVRWDNTATGDNNPDVASVTADFTAFGGGAAVTATNASNIWTASYTIAAGSINATNRSVVLTATDNVGNSTTYTKTPGSAVNNTVLVVSNGNVTITQAGDYTVMGTTTANSITVNPNITGDVNLTLDGVDIDVSSLSKTALSVGTGSTVNLTLTGVNTLKSGAGRAGVQVPSGAILVITEESAGSLNATGGDSSAGIGGVIGGTPGSITVNGGSVTATGGNMAAGIGGGYNGAGGSITINGGTVTATGVNMAAGIGGGYNGGAGTILIAGGTVIAASDGYAAGIGGGSSGTGGSIAITGGTVTARVTGYNGAGIGGGSNSAGITISITGGNITATGAGNGAGIGGGQNGTVASIAISGDTTIVNATGGNCGAGIGGGSKSPCGDITISGGTVTAKGGVDAPGIGNGAYCTSDSGSVSISGGTVDATGGNDGAGIGGGVFYEGKGFSSYVSISGGTVTATGGDDGAGIGSGRGGNGGSLTITGGVVTATRGYFTAKDLGAGTNGSFGPITITGGSVKATNGTASPTPTDGSSPVYCVAVTTTDSLSSQQTVEYKVDSADYASITTHPDGKLYLWQTRSLHQFTVDYSDTVYSSTFTPAANNSNQITLKLARTLYIGDYSTPYNGSPVSYEGTAIIEPSEGAMIAYSFYPTAEDRAADVNWLSTNPINVGTYYVRAFISSDATYGSVFAYATMTITKAYQEYPTDPVVNDDANTFDFTFLSNRTDVSFYEYSTNGGVSWNNVTDKPISVGNIAIPAGHLQVRLKGNENYYEGDSLTNPSAFTATLEGSVTLSGTPKFGQPLTATVTGAQTSAELTYEWKRGSTVISGATSSTYTLTQDDIGKTITVSVTAPPYVGSLTDTTATTVTKADGPAAPATLTVTALSHSSVTLNLIPGAEYRNSLGETLGAWKDSNVFSGLPPTTQYTFAARIKETDTHFASDITTITACTRPIPPTADNATINYTNETIAYDSSLFELNTANDFTGTAIANSGSVTSYVGTDLYLRIKADGVIPPSEAVTVTLPARPAAPAIDRISRTLTPGFGITATVQPVSGSPKYLVNGGAWRDSPEFTNLLFNTPYSFQVVYPATATTFHSALSAPETITWTSADFNAGEIADLITSITAPAVGATTLTLPTVPAGYTVAIKSVSPDTTTLALDGTITPPTSAKTVTVVLTVTRTSDSDTADTVGITVTIPAKRSTGGGTGGSTGGTGSTDSRFVQDVDIYTGSGHTSVTLTGDATAMTARQIDSLISQNATDPIIIRGAGYTVTFPVGSMKQSLGGRNVDFALVFNWASSRYTTIKPLAGTGFVMLLDFLHSGALPGTANIRVNVGTAFAGKTLYYYYYNPDYKAFEYRQAGVVDAAGFITLSQSRCSQYVLSTTALSNERPGIPETGGGAQAPTRSAPLLFTLPQSRHEDEQPDESVE